MSAPRGTSPYDIKGPTGDAKWIKPCGMMGGESEDISLGSEFDSEMVFEQNEELTTIVLTARQAQGHASSFRDEYVKSTFNLDFEQHHESWKPLRYDWLPTLEQIPKNLGESTPIEHLKTLELSKALKDSYTYLQKFAVGLEQIVWDLDDTSLFKSAFQFAEYNLRSLLCEIQSAMVERNVKQHADITRAIMSREFRDMNKSLRNIRDWFIFRDYMNGLEYVVDVFQYFIDQKSS